jgi:hemoglobin
MTTAARHDIEDPEDIAELMAEFYRQVFADHLLGPIFTVARIDLPAHLPVMGEFWATVLLGAGTYHRNALRPHLALATRVELTATHFARWLTLWTATVDEHYAGRRAELAKIQAVRIAGAIDRRVRAASTAQPRTAHPPLRPVQEELS